MTVLFPERAVRIRQIVVQIEAIDRKLVGALQGMRLHAIVTRDGSTNLLARAGIPYTQLGRLPT